MKVENLADYPVQLGDGRMIGASGTDAAVREYKQATLAASDQERVNRKLLAVVSEPMPDKTPESKKGDNK